MRAIILGSGSKGNSTLILDKDIKILIDVGFSYLRTKELLNKYNIETKDLNGILITHTHKDHIGGLKQLVKKDNIKVYANSKLKGELLKIIDEENIELVSNLFNIGHLNIMSINTSHDAIGSVGFVIENEKTNLVYVTDTGYLSKKSLEKLVDKYNYIFESNHDVEMLMEGPYPYILKQRILSDKGHLSNKLCSEYLKNITGPNTKKVVLAHLSETNNKPDIAFNENREVLNENINLLVASQDNDLDLGEL